MSETHTPDQPPSVDDMAARLSKQAYVLAAERSKLLEQRGVINERLKYLNVEIDKAERMTKALIPRHRSSSKTVEVD
jgi:hypothetical protein